MRIEYPRNTHLRPAAPEAAEFGAYKGLKEHGKVSIAQCGLG
jgi:hypothetical protein